LGRPTLATNGLQLGEVAKIEAQMFDSSLHFNRCTDVQLTTKTAILPMQCYMLCFLEVAQRIALFKMPKMWQQKCLFFTRRTFYCWFT
jgi:hypothetical protein